MSKEIECDDHILDCLDNHSQGLCFLWNLVPLTNEIPFTANSVVVNVEDGWFKIV